MVRLTLYVVWGICLAILVGTALGVLQAKELPVATSENVISLSKTLKALNTTLVEVKPLVAGTKAEIHAIKEELAETKALLWEITSGFEVKP